jgi:hypothetical protein
MGMNEQKSRELIVGAVNGAIIGVIAGVIVGMIGGGVMAVLLVLIFGGEPGAILKTIMQFIIYGSIGGAPMGGFIGAMGGLLLKMARS